MASPNLFIIHTDQLSSWALSAYGGRLVETPNIDRLAAEGALFTNFFTNTAVCTPSRGCTLTGRYPHAHGAYSNNIPLNRDEVTFAEVLRREGYATGYAGKWHLDGLRRPGWVHEERPMGFSDCRFMFNRGHFKKIEELAMEDLEPAVFPYSEIGDEVSYPTDWLTAKAIDFIDAHRSEPFCYMVAYPDPHPPVTCRPPYDMMYRPEEMPVPESFTEQDLPDWAAKARARGPFALDVPDREELLKSEMASYCGEVRLIDDAVGRLIAALSARNLAEDTIVVFTTDHGEYMGEHGLYGKNQLYETAYRIPLIVRWPGVVSAGARIDRMVATVDLQPTLLGLMQKPFSGREQGHDASPFLLGEERAWPDEVMVHHSTHERAGIFTPDYELALVRDGDGILFDRRKDPLQIANRYNDPAYREIRATLTRKVVLHHIETASPASGWLRAL